MTKSKTYRIVCHELDLVLFVKGYSLKEEKRLYESLRDKILKEKAPIRLEDYKNFIVKRFLVDVDAFFDMLGTEDVEEMNEAVGSVYNSIIALYPPFALEFICTDLNADTFMSGVERKLVSQVKDHLNSKEPIADCISLSSLEDITALEEFFKDNIIGQRKALEAIIKAIKLMASGLSGHSSFLFVGPTGVGKTQVGKLLGEKFSGNFYKINCAEYAGGHEYAKLIGSPPGYVGHTEKSLLAEKAEQSNRWVFLFDEIEKAHHKLYDFLLSLLDDGTCTDNLGTVLDFSESIFIFTSNQGMTTLNKQSVGFENTQRSSKQFAENVIHDSVKNHFSPEFLNRIDDIVIFDHLTKEEVSEIAQLQLEDLPIEATDSLVSYVVDKGYSNEYGARNIARFIKNNVSDKIADAILNKLIPKKEGAYYTPRICKDGMKIINTQKYNVSSSG